MANPTTRAQQLQSLSNSFPVGNQQTANALDANRKLQLQQSIAAINPTTQASISQPAEKLGVASTQQQATNQLGAVETQQKQMGELGKQAIAEQQRGAATQAGLEARDTATQGQDLNSQLSALNDKVKNQLVDRQMQIERDKAGNAVLNTRQLADLAVLKSNNAAQLQQYQQSAEQAWQRKLEMMKAAEGKIEQALTLNRQRNNTLLSHDQAVELAQSAADLKMQQKRAAANAANRGKMFQAGGAIVGAVAGGVLGSFAGPVGTVAGAQAGGALGGGLGALVGSQT